MSHAHDCFRWTRPALKTVTRRHALATAVAWLFAPAGAALLPTTALAKDVSATGKAASSSADASPVDFVLPGLDGRQYALSAFRGKWVVVNFWATWCGTCIEEMGELQSFSDAHEDAQVLGVNFEEIDPALLSEFVADLKVTFPILLVGEKPLLPFEPLKGLPTTAIVDPDGQMVAHHTGAVTRAALEQFIEAERSRS